MYLPEQSKVCVCVPSPTVSDIFADANPKNLSMVLTASWSVLTADRAYVSSASTQAEKIKTKILLNLHKINEIINLKKG